MLKKKQRLLLKVIEESQRISHLRLVKLMFIISSDNSVKRLTPVYDFVPYKFGPFSFDLYNDLRILRGREMISETDESVSYGHQHPIEVDPRVESEVRSLVQRMKQVDDRNLMEQIYDEYPGYTIFSEVDRRMDFFRNEKGIITIGYEGMTIDAFIAKLLEHKVHRIVDVRKNPVSRRYGMSKTKMQEILAKFEIEYSHMPELGIGSSDRRGLTTLEDYRSLFKRYRIWIGEDNQLIDEIIALGKEQKIALMCFEQDSDYCHRGVIADFIRERGCEVIEV
jgi:uncharacterized protein (DUF488 family)